MSFLIQVSKGWHPVIPQVGSEATETTENVIFGNRRSKRLGTCMKYCISILVGLRRSPPGIFYIKKCYSTLQGPKALRFRPQIAQNANLFLEIMTQKRY